MIRNEQEYKEAIARVEDEKIAMAKERERLIGQGLSEEHAEVALESFLTFHLQLVDEIEEYENLQSGQIHGTENLGGLGRRLILARLYRKMTQQELADRLGVTVQQVSRDEKNEYHNAGTAKIVRVLKALGVMMKSSFEMCEPPPELVSA